MTYLHAADSNEKIRAAVIEVLQKAWGPEAVDDSFEIGIGSLMYPGAPRWVTISHALSKAKMKIYGSGEVRIKAKQDNDTIDDQSLNVQQLNTVQSLMACAMIVAAELRWH